MILENINNNKNNKILFFFSMINLYIYIYGFISFDSVYPLSEAILMFFLSFIIFTLQILVLYCFKKIGFVISVFFSSGNFFFFNLILNDQSRDKKLAYLLIFLCIYILLNFINKAKTILVFISILVFSTFIKNYFINSFKDEDISSIISYNQKVREIKPNIFFIGIDGMMSSTMYNYFFLTESPASRMLDSLFFSRYDLLSPGQSTLETYAKLFSYKNDFHPRFSHKIINSNSSLFFMQTKKMGYKKQFNFISNYFGGDPNNIFDSYYPKIIKPFSFVLFTDERWGWYSAYLIKKIISADEKDEINITQNEMIYSQIQSIDIKNNKWVSISHLWFPGHTIGNYNFLNASDFKKYKIYYENSQVGLSVFFKRVTNLILNNDKNAIIIFYGDHGAYLLKGASNGITMNDMKITDSLLMYDKRHIQLAVYPSNYLSKEDINKIKLNPEYLFKIIIEK